MAYSYRLWRTVLYNTHDVYRNIYVCIYIYLLVLCVVCVVQGQAEEVEGVVGLPGPLQETEGETGTDHI